MHKQTSSLVEEEVLVKLYMELTGVSESNARCVVTYVESASERKMPELHPSSNVTASSK